MHFLTRSSPVGRPWRRCRCAPDLFPCCSSWPPPSSYPLAAAATPTSNPHIDLDYLIKNAGHDESTTAATDDPEDGASDFPGLDTDYDEDDQEDLFGDDDGPEEEPQPDVDEAHVLLLTAANFSSVLAAHRHVMVEFYAPWCGHYRSLAPHYAAAASHLAGQGVDVALAKVDATEDHDLAQAHDVQGYPALLFFIDGVYVLQADGCASGGIEKPASCCSFETEQHLEDYEKACEELSSGVEMDPENDEMDKLFWRRWN